MAIALPIRTRITPSVLAGQPNGELPARLLTWIDMPGGGRALVLAQCAPKWLAFLDAAARAGFPLSQNGDYRPLADQIDLLKRRYVRVGYKADIFWDGSWWEHRTGATVATPGKSNHGWGLAIDLCLSGGRSLTDAAVRWIVDHELAYGLSHEISSEDWHVRPFDGDSFTPAVLAWIAAHPITGGTSVTTILDKGARGDAVGKMMAEIIAAGGALPGSTKADGTFDNIYGGEAAGQLALLLGVGDGSHYDTGDRALLLQFARDRRPAPGAVDPATLRAAVKAVLDTAVVGSTVQSKIILPAG